MENNFDSIELEEMRQQMATLQSRLDEQLQLNEEQLQKSLSNQTNHIHHWGLLSFVAGIIVAILFPFVFYYMYGFSIACCIFSSLLIIADASYDYWSAHRIKPSDFSTKSVTETIHTLVSMKKLNAKEFILSVLVLIPMIIWWGYEFWNSHFFDFIEDEKGIEMVKYITLTFGAICGVIGLCIAIHLYKKQKRNIEELIRMINK